MIRTKIVAVGLFCALAMAPASPALAVSFENFLGSWTGQGELLDTENQSQMRVRCALDGAQPDPDAISLKLKCASRQGARTIKIEIKKTAAGAIDRVIVDLPSARAQGFVARLTDRRIALEHPERGSLSLEKTAEGVSLALADVAAISGTILLK